MPLVLQPALPEQTRAEVEAHLEHVRAKRMSAAVTYYEGKNAKYQHESDKIKRQMSSQYDMLGKELAGLDKAIEKVEQRLVKIGALDTSLGLVSDMMVVLDPEEGNE